MKTMVNLGEDPIPRLFFKYYTPAVTTLLSVTIQQVVNALILSRYVGKEGVAAVGIFGPVFTIFIAFALMLMIGGGIVIARAVGAKNYAQAQQVFQFTTSLTIVVGAIIALAAPLITAALTKFLVGDNDIALYRSAHDYIFWALLWLPFFFLRMIWSNALSSDGHPRVTRNASVMSVALNILLDVLLIIIFPLGTAGASIATGISVIAGTVFLFVYIARGKSHFGFSHFKFTLHFPWWKELVCFGIPSFVSEMSFASGLLIINKNILVFGSQAVAAFGVVNQLSFVFIRFFTAAMMSVIPIMSFNIGARQPQRVIATLRFGTLLTLSLGCGLTICGFLFSDQLVNLFSGTQSVGEFRALVTSAIGLYFFVFIVAGPNYVLAAYLQAIGKTMMSILLNVLKGALLVFVFVVIFQNINFQIDGVWLVRSAAEFGALLIVGLFTLGKRAHYYSDEAILHNLSRR